MSSRMLFEIMLLRLLEKPWINSFIQKLFFLGGMESSLNYCTVDIYSMP